MYEIFRFIFLILLMLIATVIGATISVFLFPKAGVLVCIIFMGLVYGSRKNIFKFYDRIFKKKK